AAIMSFDLEPVDYLRMLKEEHDEYRRSRPESRTRSQRSSSPRTGKHSPSRSMCASSTRMRSAPHRSRSLRFQQARASPNAGECECEKRGGSHTTGRRLRGLLAVTRIREIERLRVTHQDGRTELMGDVLKQVIDSWDVIFPRDHL